MRNYPLSHFPLHSFFLLYFSIEKQPDRASPAPGLLHRKSSETCVIFSFLSMTRLLFFHCCTSVLIGCSDFYTSEVWGVYILQ
jgi:hypothetical protein